MSIVLVDSTGRQGATARMLEVAAEHQVGTVLEVVTADKFRQTAINSNFADSAIFVSVAETDLSMVGDVPGIRRTACESLQIGQMVAGRGGKVILVTQPGDSRITGIDAAAALVAGIVGIVDDRVLLMDGVLKSFLTHQHIDRRWRKMLTMGETAARLRNVKDMFDEWDEDDSSDGIQDAACFKACMALAQLDRLRPLRGQGHKYSYVQLARALNFAQPETSFRLSEGDLRRVLSIVANRLIPAEDDESERIHLPSHVKREWEFPRNLPVVQGISEREIYQVLYEACRSMEVTAPGLNLDRPACVARLPLRELRHLQRDRPR